MTRTAKTLCAGPFENNKSQKTHHVEAGTIGRLIRACMNLARHHPEWRPVGPLESYKGDRGQTIYRQRVTRPDTGET